MKKGEATPKQKRLVTRTNRRMCSHVEQGICMACRDPRRRVRFESRDPMPSLLHRATARQ